MIVVLPHPERPTIATFAPLGIVRLTPWRTGWPGEYPNVTSSKTDLVGERRERRGAGLVLDDERLVEDLEHAVHRARRLRHGPPDAGERPDRLEEHRQHLEEHQEEADLELVVGDHVAADAEHHHLARRHRHRGARVERRPEDDEPADAPEESARPGPVLGERPLLEPEGLDRRVRGQALLRRGAELAVRGLRLVARLLEPLVQEEVADPEERHRRDRGEGEPGVDVEEHDRGHDGLDDDVDGLAEDGLGCLANAVDVTRQPHHEVAEVRPRVVRVREVEQPPEDLVLELEQHLLAQHRPRVLAAQRDGRRAGGRSR